jgi:hypothetical protein
MTSEYVNPLPPALKWYSDLLLNEMADRIGGVSLAAMMSSGTQT